jgi:hypothetical protein
MRFVSFLAAACGFVVLSALLVNGCASDPSPVDPMVEIVKSLEVSVRANVSDPDRAEQVVALLTRLESELERFGRDLQATRKRLFEMNRNYDATRTDFDAIWKQCREARTAFARTMFDVRRKAATLMTAEEWDAVYAAILPAGSN